MGAFVVGQLSMLPLSRARTVKVNVAPPLRLFVMGSPRSGSSELGSTLSKVPELAWLGEDHTAPLFGNAANALIALHVKSDKILELKGEPFTA